MIWYKLRKVLPVLLIAVVTAFAGTVSPAAGSAAEAGNLLGDVNCDGRVSINDATSIQRRIARLSESGSFSEPAADVNGSGGIAIDDATLIQMYLAGIETPYPIGEPLDVPAETTCEPTTEPPVQRQTDADGWGREIFQP